MKRLYRSKKNRVLAGVCGGIGEYFNIDPVIIRIIAVILLLVGGSGILAYIIGIIIIPENPEQYNGQPQQYKDPVENPNAVVSEPSKEPVEGSSDTGALLVGLVLVVIGGVFLMRNLPFLDHYYYWIKHQIKDFFWPAVLIGFGMFMIFKSTRK